MIPSTHTQTRTYTAANDNPGGATSVDVPLSAFVTLMAKAYVAKAHANENTA